MWNTRSRHYGRRDLTGKDIRCCLLIGNSRWHWAIERSDRWHFLHTRPEPEKIVSLETPLIKWASVGHLPKEIQLNPANRLELKDIPLKKLPSWLGIDRALAGWGAFKKTQLTGINSSGLLVADAGTVLSLTRITSKGEFAGGQLIAGLNLQLAAMAVGTKNLNNPGPGLTRIPLFPFTTAEAMQRGSLQSLIGAILEAINATEENIPLWLCGGDSPLLIEELQKRNTNVIHQPDLVLEGMVDLQKEVKPNPNLE
ncbi:type III pantothenate kinase [Prochlorococcus sp. MIT 1307]|uniref:type III pantothenate kinase n=1 Tax=Prochlorococcus sp. MIT 1307 TaxID=3096219 RepID=UPI002A750883|nr:type III pantothenate kinase [Prochlorococcus sp. MIT 1307]